MRTIATIEDRLVFTKGRPSGFDYVRIALALSILLWHSVIVCFGSKADLYFYSGWTRPPIAILLPMFFALSGFLVAGSLERTKFLPTFLGLRILRIVPALACEVTLSALILGPVFTSLPLHDYFSSPIFASYFLNILGEPHFALPGVFAANPSPFRVNAQIWTIPFELTCYLALSGLAISGIFGRRRLLLVAMACVQILLVSIAVTKYRAAVGAVAGLTMVASFLAGALLFRFRDRTPWHPALGLLSLAVSLLLFLVPNGERFCALPVAYFTVWVGLYNPYRSRLLFSGDYSYGIYLYGAPLQQALAATSAVFQIWYLNMAAAIPCTLLIATLSWWCVEKPALRLRKYLTLFESVHAPRQDALLRMVRRLPALAVGK